MLVAQVKCVDWIEKRKGFHANILKYYRWIAYKNELKQI